MKGSLIIVGFFALGTLCGAYKLIPADLIADSQISFYALCALMFSVGISVGNDPQTLKNFRSLNPPADLPAHYDHSGYIGRFRRRQPHLDTPFSDRLPRHRFRIRLLFALKHIHHRIQGSRTGNNRLACQHQP